MFSRLRSISFGSVKSETPTKKESKREKTKAKDKKTEKEPQSAASSESEQDAVDDRRQDEEDDDLLSTATSRDSQSQLENDEDDEDEVAGPRTPRGSKRGTKGAAKGQDPTSKSPANKPPTSAHKPTMKRGALGRLLRRASSQSLVAKSAPAEEDASSEVSDVSSQGPQRTRSLSNPFRMLTRRSLSFSSRHSDAASSVGAASQASKSSRTSRGSFLRRKGGSFLRRRSSRRRAESDVSEVPPSDVDSDEELDQDEPAPQSANLDSKGAKSSESDVKKAQSGNDEPPRSRSASATKALRKSTPVRLARRAGKAVGKFGNGKLMRLRGLQTAKGPAQADETNDERSQGRGAEHESIETSSSVSRSSSEFAARMSQSFFTQREFQHLRALAGESTHETLVDLLGEHGADDAPNALLVAKFADLIGENNSEVMHNALGVLRGPDVTARLALLYHLHNLQDHAEGPGAEDLRCVLRHTPQLRRAAPPLDSADGKAALKQFESLVPRLRLEAFYLANAPERLTRLDAIEAKYRGREDTLWKKLGKQYDGQTVPSAQDVASMVAAQPTVEALVEAALEGAKRLSFPAFVRWLAGIDDGAPAFRAPQLAPHATAPSWDDLLASAEVDTAKTDPLQDWLRVAPWTDPAQGRKLRLSELPFRRRWCKLVRSADGASVSLQVFRDDHARSSEMKWVLTSPETDVELVERPKHKHMQTVFLPHQRVFLQVSRASEHALGTWLAHLRAATHVGRPDAVLVSPQARQQVGSDLLASPSPTESSSRDSRSCPRSELVPEDAESYDDEENESDDKDDEEEEEEDDDEDDDDDDDDEEEEEEEEEGASTENRGVDLKKLRVRLEAFYLKQNPDKLGTLDFIMTKYQGREARLVQQLEHQYEGARVPSYEAACRILSSAQSGRKQGQKDNDDESDDERRDEEGEDSGSEIHEHGSDEDSQDGDETSDRVGESVESDSDDEDDDLDSRDEDYDDEDDEASGVLDDVASDSDEN